MARLPEVKRHEDSGGELRWKDSAWPSTSMKEKSQEVGEQSRWPTITFLSQGISEHMPQLNLVSAL